MIRAYVISSLKKSKYLCILLWIIVLVFDQLRGKEGWPLRSCRSRGSACCYFFLINDLCNGKNRRLLHITIIYQEARLHGFSGSEIYLLYKSVNFLYPQLASKGFDICLGLNLISIIPHCCKDFFIILIWTF